VNLSRDEFVQGSPSARRAHYAEVRDEDLIVMVQEGQRKAYDELVSRYKGRLFSFILRMVKDPTLAE
jgi:DNA-directed RNA polymerase specialized sigma24 family protein